MNAPSLHDLLTQITQELDGRYLGVTTSVLFDISDGDAYRLIVDRGKCHLEPGAGAAHATAAASEQVLIDLLTGNLDPDYALQAGKVQAEGDFRILSTLAAALSTKKEHDEPLLDPRYPRQAMPDLLLPREKWHPYPTINDRAGWHALPETLRKALIAQGEEALDGEWPVLLAVRYLDYARNGNRTRFAEVRSLRRHMLLSLVMAECVEAQGRFLDEIANGIWLICEESSWCVPAHIGVQRAGVGLPDTTEPIVDLFCGETSALLAWVVYLLGARLDDVSPLIRPRVQREIDARVLTPCLERDDFWWMGFTPRRVNNWNPWINSNWLTSALLMEADPGRRVEAVAKSMRSLDRFLDPYPRDGGCDEGPGYWGRAGASLLDCLELLYSATDGAIDVYGVPLIQEMGRYIYRVQIEGHWFVNFADASALVGPTPSVVYQYGLRIGDAEMTAMGAWLAAYQDLAHPQVDRMGSLGRLLPALFLLDDLIGLKARQPLPRDVWLPEIEVMVARDRAGSSEGLFVAAKGGH
ncbi:MAG: SCP2 sterol-binding domain-containing protein, partial [Anaerolineae bacterium]